MLRVYYEDDFEEISHTANDLRIVIRKCIKNWQSALTQKKCQLANRPEHLHARAVPGRRYIHVSQWLVRASRRSLGRAWRTFHCQLPRRWHRGTGDCDSGATVPCEARFDRLTFPPRAWFKTDNSCCCKHWHYLLVVASGRRLAHKVAWPGHCDYRTGSYQASSVTMLSSIMNKHSASRAGAKRSVSPPSDTCC